MSIFLEGLNKDQKEAVMTTEGPISVIAGAGSGKTRVLINRIGYILENKNVYPSNILAITFTNKATKEIRDRLSSVLAGLNYETKYLNAYTFHGLCSSILRQFIELLGYNKDFEILSEYNRNKYLYEAAKLAKIIDYSGSIDGNKVTPKNFLKILKSMEKKRDTFEDELVSLYRNFAELKKKNNVLDFDDLLLLTVKLLKEQEEVRNYLSNKYKYILVDEFQDTNSIQFELIDLLINGKTKPNLFVVGDQNQGIYGFRGANHRAIEQISKRYGSKTIMLQQNYRSTKSILDLSNNVISNNKSNLKYEQITTNEEGVLPIYHEANNDDEEARYVSDIICDLVDNKGYTYNDFAVIYRANRLSRKFEEAFRLYRIPYKMYGGLSFYDRKEVQDIVSYLRVIASTTYTQALTRIINTPKRGIGSASIDKLFQHYDGNGDLIEKIVNDELGFSNAKIKQFATDIKDIRSQIETIDLPEIIDIVLNKFGYIEYLKSEEPESLEDRKQNIYEIKTALVEAQYKYEGTNTDVLFLYLDEISLLTGEENETNGVSVATMHKSKGLEFKVVFVVGLEDDILPAVWSFESSDSVEEERRIFYVAVTRAEQLLYLTSAKMRVTFGEAHLSKQSRFVREIDKNLYKSTAYIDTNRNDYQTSSSDKLIPKVIPKYKPQGELDLVKGDKVVHKIFGEGVVTKCESGVATIAFSLEHGIKNIKTDHPSISISK